MAEAKREESAELRIKLDVHDIRLLYLMAADSAMGSVGPPPTR